MRRLRTQTRVDFTKQKGRIWSAFIQLCQATWNGTDAYDAVYETLDKLGRLPGWRVLVVVAGAMTVSVHIRWRTQKKVEATDDHLVFVYLFTGLELPVEEVVELYRRRYNIETHLRSLKRTVRLHHVTAKSEHTLANELRIIISAYNLVRAVMSLAARRAHCGPRQLSFACILDLVNNSWPRLTAVRTQPEQGGCSRNCWMRRPATNRLNGASAGVIRGQFGLVAPNSRSDKTMLLNSKWHWAFSLCGSFHGFSRHRSGSKPSHTSQWGEVRCTGARTAHGVAQTQTAPLIAGHLPMASRLLLGRAR